MQYPYESAEHNASHAYLLPALLRCLESIPARRIFELGCGNGAMANALSGRGYEVIGVDPSEAGVAQARRAYPGLRCATGDGYEDLAARFGRFPIVLSLEVIEHVYDPRLFVRRCFELLEHGGSLVLSTPFHGYWKNLAIALSGKTDKHLDPLWDGGHIKFWSERTLGTLLSEAGFVGVRFTRAGRVAPLAKSMLAIAKRP